MRRGRTYGYRRLGWAFGLATALVVGSVVQATVDDRPGRTAVLVAQKVVKKKKTSKKGKAEAPAPADMVTTKDIAPPSDGSPSFAKEVAPILVANCVNCHGTNANNRSKLNQTTFSGLMKGGKSGKAIQPGSPDDSLLLLRVKGEGGPKMPPGGQRNLSGEAIGKIEAWIKAGARLDAGLNPDEPLAKYASTPEDLRRIALSKMPASERDKIAENAGLERWKKGDPKNTPQITPSAHFLLFGNLPKTRAAATLKAMESQLGIVKRLFAQSRETGLGAQEKIGLYIFKDQKSFIEFARAVESQDVEASETARARLTVESPYIAAADPLAWGEETESSSASRKSGRSKKSSGDDALGGGSAERTLVGLMTEQLASAAVVKAGQPPRWVSAGFGAYLASKVEPRSPYYRKLRMEAVRQHELGWQTKANQALGGEGTPEAIRAVGFSILEWVGATSPEDLIPLIGGMIEGGQTKTDDVIRDTLEGDRKTFLDATEVWVQTKYQRSR